MIDIKDTIGFTSFLFVSVCKKTNKKCKISSTVVTIKDKGYHDTLDPIQEQSHLFASLWR